MALKVWLPLNGDLENKGISDITIINNGATIDNNGKIGKCYSFNGNYIKTDYSNYPNIFSGDFSICFWVYSTTNKARDIYFANYGLSGSGNWFNLERDANNYLRFWWNNGSPDYHNSNFTINQNEWTHISVTKSENTLTFYKNGSLINSYTTTLSTTIPLTATTFYLGADYRTGQSIDLYGKINDFRLYDHCLSAKEVKEISQGLILHYKLDGFSGGAGENLAIDTANKINTSTGASKTVTLDYGLQSNFNLIRGKKITISADIILENAVSTATSGSKRVGFEPAIKYSDNTVQYMGYWIGLDSNPKNSSGRYSTTVTVQDKDFLSIAQNGIYIQGLTSGTATIKNVKVELGEKATPWTPSLSEMGIDTSKIIDSSGYGNDGIVVGSLQASQDSERYGISTAFAASSAINCGRNAMVTDSITVSLWAKYSTFSNLMSCTESGGWNFENSSGLTFPVYVNSVGYVHIDAASRPPVANYANAWHMFTGVYDRLNQLVKLYIDGELIGTGAVSAPNPIRYHSTNCIWVNAEATGSNTAANYGNAKLISDVRIYATALSAEDIVDLYHTPANIDNLGGIHGFEFIEKTPNLLNPDPKEWTIETSVTCVWNEETGYFDVNTNRDTSVTSRWGVYTGVPIKPNTTYLFSAEVLDNKSYIGVAGGTSSRSLPSNIISWNGEKRYYYFFTTSSSHTHAWVYLCSKPSETTAGHFKNIYLGEVGEIASIKQNGIFENEDMVEYNENGRITKSGELAGSNFIEK